MVTSPPNKRSKIPIKIKIDPIKKIGSPKIVNNHFQKLDFELGHFDFLISGFGSSRDVDVDPDIIFISVCVGLTLLIKG